MTYAPGSRPIRTVDRFVTIVALRVCCVLGRVHWGTVVTTPGRVTPFLPLGQFVASNGLARPTFALWEPGNRFSLYIYQISSQKVLLSNKNETTFGFSRVSHS